MLSFDWLRLSDNFFMQLAGQMVCRVSHSSLLCTSRDGVSIPSKSVLELIAELDARGWVRKGQWRGKRNVTPYATGRERVWYGRDEAVPYKDYLIALLRADESDDGRTKTVHHLQCKAYYQLLKKSDMTNVLLAHQPAQYYKAILRRQDKSRRGRLHLHGRWADENDEQDGVQRDRGDRGDIMDLDKIAQAQIRDASPGPDSDDQPKHRKHTTKAKGAKRARNDDGVSRGRGDSGGGSDSGSGISIGNSDSEDCDDSDSDISDCDGNEGSDADDFDAAAENKHATDWTEEAGASDSFGDISGRVGRDVVTDLNEPGVGPGDTGCDNDGEGVVGIISSDSDDDIAAGTSGVGVAPTTSLDPANESQSQSGDHLVKRPSLHGKPSKSKMILENNDDPLLDSDPTPGVGVSVGEHEGNELQLYNDNPPGPARPEVPEQMPQPARADGGGGGDGEFKPKVRSSKGHQHVCQVVLPVLLQTLKEPMWQNSDSRMVLREALRRFLVHESRYD